MSYTRTALLLTLGTEQYSLYFRSAILDFTTHRLPPLLSESSSEVGALLVCGGPTLRIIRGYMSHGGRHGGAIFGNQYVRSLVFMTVFVAGPPGFEPGTSGSEGRRPILARLRARPLLCVPGVVFYILSRGFMPSILSAFAVTVFTACTSASL